MDIKEAAVVGAGTMGGGIAMCFANAGIPVKVYDNSPEGLERGVSVIRSNYARTVSKGRLSQSDMDDRMAKIEPVSTMEAFQNADVVVEAVYENLDLKKQIFETLDGIMKPGALLATNTSGLDVDAIAASTSRPESVCGMHFFSPANVMRLLEVVRGEASSPETLATPWQWVNAWVKSASWLATAQDSLVIECWGLYPTGKFDDSGGRSTRANRPRHVRIRFGHGSFCDGGHGWARSRMACSQDARRL